MLQLLNNQLCQDSNVSFFLGGGVNEGQLKMSTIKNGHISYCHFHKIIKGPETSFESLALSQKHVKKFFIQHISI